VRSWAVDSGTLLRRARALAFDRLGLAARARRRLDGSCAAILYYHRVIPQAQAERGCVEPGMYVTPDSFRHQLDWLDEHFRVLPLHEVTRGLAEETPLPERACAITFDDGWRDNHDYALPELQRRSMPATVFVATQRVGTDGAFWPDEVCRRLAPLAAAARQRLVAQLTESPNSAGGIDDLLDYLKLRGERDREPILDQLRSQTAGPVGHERELMDWDELERLARAGIDIESHSASHAILTGLPAGEMEAELRDSRAALRERGHGQHDLLAYPSGSYDGGVMQAAREQGYRFALTTDHGLALVGSDAFALPRLCVHQGIAGSREEFLFKIPGWS